MKTSASAKRGKPVEPIKRKKAEDPEKLLQAGMGSFYPHDGPEARVKIRFIQLTSDNQAIITVLVGATFYSATVSREHAINSSDLYDIIVENGVYRHIRQKIIYNTNNETRLQTLELPSVKVEPGEVHSIALYAPKNTVLRLDQFIDTVFSRTLYHLRDGTKKFVIKTSGNRVFEHPIEPGTGPLGVPGDFEIHEDEGYVRLITHRLMLNSIIRDEGSPIWLP